MFQSVMTRAKSRRIYIEYPSSDDWLFQDKNKQVFLQSITLANKQLKNEVVCLPTPYPCYGIPRLKPNYLLISFHSFDNPKGVFSYKESPINGLFSLDEKGYGGWADICLNYHKYEKKICSISEELSDEILRKFQNQLLNGDSKHPQVHTNDKLPKEYIFFPLQVRNDSVADLSNIEILDVLKTVSGLAKKHKKHIVIKTHPFCNSEALKSLTSFEASNNPYFHLSSTHVITLIEKSTRVLACNSGVSLEALILEKDVYCFGKSEWYEITNKIVSLDDLEQVFLSPEKQGLSLFQKQYLAFLLDEYWIQFNDIGKVKDKIKLFLDSISDNQLTDENEDLYSELNSYLLEKQKDLTERSNQIKIQEKDYEYLKDFLKYLRENPMKLIRLVARAYMKKISKKLSRVKL